MTTSRNERQVQWIGDSALSTSELHDFSDLRSNDGQPNRMLRWVVGIAAILVASHFAFGPAEMTPERHADVTTTAPTTSL